MNKFIKYLDDKLHNRQNIDPNSPRYAGLNIRLLANLFDLTVIMIIITPLIFFVNFPQFRTLPAQTPPEVIEAYKLHAEGKIDNAEFKQRVYPFLRNVIAPKIIIYFSLSILILGVIYISSWKYMDSTPGKRIFNIKIVDEKTFSSPTIFQYVIRYLAYFVSVLPLCLGFLIIPLNKRKRGLHDYIADTAVIYAKPLSEEYERKKKRINITIGIILLIISIIYISNKIR